MQHNGFTMNSEKDPEKRKAKLRDRIKHLKEQREVIEDQIQIMKDEIHSIDVKIYLDSVEARPKAEGK